MTEREFQRQVVDLARWHNWRIYHQRPARNQQGRWSIHLTGDPGLPDLLLVRPPRIIFAELKSPTGRLSEAQQEWLYALSRCDCECYCWRPADWDAIVDCLRERV